VTRTPASVDGFERQGRTPQLFLLTGAVMAVTYARTALSPLQESMRSALGLSDNQIALLQGSALALPVVVASVPLGLLIDRTSRVRLLLMFAVLAAIASVTTALASSFSALFLSRCLVGLTATATLTTSVSLVADLYAPAQRGRATMIVSLGQVVGTAAAFVLGGILLSHFIARGEDWSTALLSMTAPLIAFAAALLWMREPPRAGQAHSRRSLSQTLVALWQHRKTLAPLLAGVIMVAIADSAVLIWAAPVLHRRFALPADQIGVVMAAAVFVSGSVGAIAGGALSDFCQSRGGPRFTAHLLSVLAFLSLPAALFPIATNVTLASILLVFFITAGSAIGVAVMPLSTVLVSNELRGLFVATLFAAGAIFGVGLAPLAVSGLSGLLGGPAMIGVALTIVCAVTSLVGALIFVHGIRRFVAA
jgi:predicted MFS family arabinose efflux permease